MPFYKSRDPNELFTGFGLSAPLDEPGHEDDDDPVEVGNHDRGELQRLAHAYGITVDRLEYIWSSFRGNQVFINLANVAVALCFCFGVHAALKTLSIQLAERDGPALLRVMYQPAIWWGVAGLGGFCMAWEITIQVWGMFTSTRTIGLYREWVRREAFHYRGGTFHNQLRFWHWCSAILVLPVGIASLLALNMHTLVGPSNLRVCGYAFKPCEVLEYRNMQHVEFYPSYGRGKKHVAAKIVAEFTNRGKWDSSEWYEGDVDPKLARFLMAKDPSRLTPELPVN